MILYCGAMQAPMRSFQSIRWRSIFDIFVSDISVNFPSLNPTMSYYFVKYIDAISVKQPSYFATHITSYLNKLHW